MTDTDSSFNLRIMAIGPDVAIVGRGAGDIIAVPRGRELVVGTDLDVDIVIQRSRAVRSRMMRIAAEGDAVFAAPEVGSVIHWDDPTGKLPSGRSVVEQRMSKRRIRIVPGPLFGPTTDVRFRLERRGALPVASRLERIRGVVVDTPPQARLFVRPGILDDAERTAVSVLVALGPEAVAAARRLVIGHAGARARALLHVEGDDALLVAVDELEGVALSELAVAASDAGTPLDDELVAFIGRALAGSVARSRPSSVEGARVRLRDGMPVLSPWSTRAAKAPDTTTIELAIARACRRFSLPHESEEADATAQPRLASLVRSLFPARCADRDELLEQARLVPAGSVAAWVVPDDDDGDF